MKKERGVNGPNEGTQTLWDAEEERLKGAKDGVFN